MSIPYKLRLAWCFLYRYLICVSLYGALSILKQHRRVLVIPQNWHVGGTRRYTKHLLQFLESKGLDVFVLLERSEIEGFVELFPIKRSQIVAYDGKFKHPNVWYNKGHSLFRYFLFEFSLETLKLLKALTRVRPGHVILSIARPTEMFFAFYLPCRVTYILHTMPWIRCDNGNQLVLNRRISASRCISTVSEYAKRAIVKHWKVNQAHVHVIFNCVENIPKDRKTDVPNEEEIRVLSIGSVIADKNPFFFIEVAKAVNQLSNGLTVNFHWYGDGNLLDECKQQTVGLNYIKFHGHTSDPISVLQSADIYFHPSLNESHGYTVIEAMSMGVPCIVTNRGGTVESVLHEQTGLVFDPTDPAEATRQLLSLIKDQNLRKHFGTEGKRRCCEVFNAATWNDNMTRMLTSL